MNNDRWTAEESEIVRRTAKRPPCDTVAELRKAGYNRSRSAIVSKRYRLMMERKTK